MWAALQHPRHVEFYEEFHRGRSQPGEDWQPMVQAVRFLQSLPDAPALFAFTSLVHFQVTTAPSYAECDGHHFVSVTWAFAERLFRLAYHRQSWIVEGSVPERVCTEAEFSTVVQPLLQRLKGESPNAIIPHNA